MRRFIISTVLALVALPAFGGATYRFRSVSVPSRTELAGSVAVEGARMRIHFDKGDQTLFKSGSVVISNDGGRTFNIIDAKKKTYTPVSVEKIISDVSSVLRSMPGMFNIAVKNQRVNVKPAGNGGIVQGLPTQKFVIDTSYKLELTIIGSRTDMIVHSKTEAWTTDRISRDYITFVQMKGIKTGLPDVDKLLDAQSKALRGFPLRQITTSRTISNGKTEESRTTVEITQFKTAPVPAAAFTIPANFKRQELSLLDLGR